MDKKKGIKNITVSILFKALILVGTLLVRRVLIHYIGNEINGLNSLYTSIIGFLAVAELGVGSAITFSMYRPIVEGNHQKVSALYRLFQRLYLIIGVIILVCGCILMPFLKYLAKDSAELDVNLYLTFGLSLIAVVLTYAYSAKTSLINAYKDNYITTAITSCGQVLQFGLQIAVVILTRSFVWYLVCAIGAALLQWLVTDIVAKRQHGDIMRDKQSVDAETKKEVIRNVKAMFMHKIGGTLVNTADSVIISAFLGVVILGKYTNYTIISSAMTGLISLFFTPLTSIIGHLYVEESGEGLKKYFHFFHTFNFLLGTVFFLGYYAIIDNLVSFCFGAGLELERSVSFVITLNYFIQFMRQATLLFRDATGTFYNDRWKPLIEGCINIILSVAFVLLFGVVGVIAATILTNLFICHIVEPHVFYKYALHERATSYYIKNYVYILLFACSLIGLNFAMQTIESGLLELLANGFIAVGIAVIPCSLAIAFDGHFRSYLKRCFLKVKCKVCKQSKNAEKN